MSENYMMKKIRDFAHTVEKSQGWYFIEQKKEMIRVLQGLIGNIESSIAADHIAGSAKNESNGSQTPKCVALAEAEQRQKMAEAIGKITLCCK